jgi:hypothetical protein
MYSNQHQSIVFRGIMDRNALSIWATGFLLLVILASLPAWF